MSDLCIGDKNVLWVCNARNGLAHRNELQTPHIGYFLSSHAHHKQCYFVPYAMPLAAIVHLLCGGVVAVVDASRRKVFPDSLVAGLGSWVYAFNRGIGVYEPDFVPYGTSAMWWYAIRSRNAREIKKVVRRLATILGDKGPARGFLYRPDSQLWHYKSRPVPLSFTETGPAVVGVSFCAASWDDRPEELARLIHVT